RSGGGRSAPAWRGPVATRLLFLPCRVRPALGWLALRARLDHGQRYAPPPRIHRQYPHGYHVAYRRHLIGILDVAIRHLANVDQAAVFEADVDERAEIDDVENRALQLHARLKVLELQDALLEDRRGQGFARIAARPGPGVQD